GPAAVLGASDVPGKASAPGSLAKSIGYAKAMVGSPPSQQQQQQQQHPGPGPPPPPRFPPPGTSPAFHKAEPTTAKAKVPGPGLLRGTIGPPPTSEPPSPAAAGTTQPPAMLGLAAGVAVAAAGTAQPPAVPKPMPTIDAQQPAALPKPMPVFAQEPPS
ncbi:unnamed protein product, partial [Polarella glacialis]